MRARPHRMGYQRSIKPNIFGRPALYSSRSISVNGSHSGMVNRGKTGAGEPAAPEACINGVGGRAPAFVRCLYTGHVHPGLDLCPGLGGDLLGGAPLGGFAVVPGSLPFGGDRRAHIPDTTVTVSGEWPTPELGLVHRDRTPGRVDRGDVAVRHPHQYGRVADRPGPEPDDRNTSSHRRPVLDGVAADPAERPVRRRPRVTEYRPSRAQALSESRNVEVLRAHVIHQSRATFSARPGFESLRSDRTTPLRDSSSPATGLAPNSRPPWRPPRKARPGPPPLSPDISARRHGNRFDHGRAGPGGREPPLPRRRTGDRPSEAWRDGDRCAKISGAPVTGREP